MGLKAKNEKQCFMRSFDTKIIEQLSGEKVDLYCKLLDDIKQGTVFPAIRKNELHFYYKGGCLF